MPGETQGRMQQMKAALQDVDCYNFKAGANPETEQDGNFWDYQW